LYADLELKDSVIAKC